MGRMSHRNQERTERRISAAASLMLCALTVLAQIAVTLLLTRFLKEKASFVYGFLQLIGAAVAIRVYQRSGSPSYKLIAGLMSKLVIGFLKPVEIHVCRTYSRKRMCCSILNGFYVFVSIVKLCEYIVIA